MIEGVMLKELVTHRDERGFFREVIRITEGYTSKCSALDLEPVKKHEKYVGRRLHRGLFKAGSGQVINADVNGSLNILRKVIGDSFVHEGANLLENPIKITMN